MFEIQLKNEHLTQAEQSIVAAGFSRHSAECAAPEFRKDRLSWVAHDRNALVGVITADLLWDWLYIDELWVDDEYRGRGLGRSLMEKAEEYAAAHSVAGLWLWTQSWQAAEFYQRLGYVEFARFPDFPRGYFRIGFRKQLADSTLK